RRLRGIGAMGEGGAGRGPACRAEEADEGAEGCCRQQQACEEDSRDKRGGTLTLMSSCLGLSWTGPAMTEQPSKRNQATWLCISAVYSGSTSQTTRLRPARLAA